jgi:hypothetical protein
LKTLGDFQWAQVFSTLALFVSLVTAYFTFFRRAKLKARFGETLFLQLTEGGRFRLNPELAMHNPGATLGVMHELSCEIRRLLDDTRESLVWEENLATVFVDEGRKRDTRFESLPGVLFIPKGEAVSKRLGLTTEHSFQPEEGNYELSAHIRTDGLAESDTNITTQLRLTKEDVQFLKENQLGPNNTTRRLLTFYFRRGPNTNCYMRAPGFQLTFISAQPAPVSSKV